MSKKIFSDDDIKNLKANKYVKNVSHKAITYTDDFKLHFLSEYEKGVTPSCIFAEAGFDLDVIGSKRIKGSSMRWRSAYKKDGISALSDSRRGNSGRPRLKERTQEEIIEKQKAEIEYLKAEVELLKKLELEERQVVKGHISAHQIFGIIQSLVLKHNFKGMIKHLCILAGVSRSGYYNYINTSMTRELKDRKDRETLQIIMKGYEFKGYDKGSRGILMALRNEFGIIFNRKRIQRIMRKFKIKCPIRKANPYRRIARATKEHCIVPNLLKREFKQGVPGKVLLTDITYMPYQKGTAYLSVVKDSSSNEIMAYYLSKNIKLEISMITIEKLISNHKDMIKADAYIHSDQGVHYSSPKFQQLLKKHALGQSMSRRGNCWDNAPMESFFGHMKDDINYKSCQTFEELQTMIDEYMNYYNNSRYQWNLKKLTPVKYRNQLLAA